MNPLPQNHNLLEGQGGLIISRLIVGISRATKWVTTGA